MKKSIFTVTAAMITALSFTGCAKTESKQTETTLESVAAAASETATETMPLFTTTAVTMSPIYPTDVPEVHQTTTAPKQQAYVEFQWDTTQKHTVSGTNTAYTPDIMTPIQCMYVADRAFSGNASVERAAFENPYTQIGAYAFENCINLKEVSFPWYMETIAPYTFQDCTSLQTLELPETVTTIGESAFFGCTGMTGLQLNEGLQVIGKTAFYGCSSLTNVYIPDGVTEIGDYAFGNCKNLLNITIPASVTKCGLYPVSGSADLPVEEQNVIQIFLQKESWIDQNFDMVFGGTSCVKVYY